MKKQILKFAMIMAVPFLLLTQSCKKDEGNTSTSTLGQATISGRIVGDLNLASGQKDGLEGIKVIARVNVSDLTTSTTTPSGAVKVYEATTDASGNYTVTVDAGSKVVNVSLELPNKINLEQTKENGTKETVEFTINGSSSRNVSLYKGQAKTENVEYISVKTLPIALVTLKGKVEYRNDLCEADPNDQLSAVPAGTKLLFTWRTDGSGTDDRQLLVDVDNNGNYEFSVETSLTTAKTINVRGVKFFANRKVLVGADCETETNYGYEHGGANSFVNKGETNILNIVFN